MIEGYTNLPGYSALFYSMLHLIGGGGLAGPGLLQAVNNAGWPPHTQLNQSVSCLTMPG